MSSISLEDGALGTGAGVDWDDAPKSEVARPPPRKRRRVVISCTECHRRKQKCDRKFPCTNCVSRSKESACCYETGAPTAKKHGKAATNPAAARVISSSSSSVTPIPLKATAATAAAPPPPPRISTTDPTTPSFGYALANAHTHCNTLSFLHTITSGTTSLTGADPSLPLPDHQQPPPPPPHSSTSPSSSVLSAAVPQINPRYRSLIRQLPSRASVARLAALYFREFNWQYAVLDHGAFDSYLGKWYRLPFEELVVDREMRAFPALVFQVCAVALLAVDGDGEGQEGDGGGEGGGEGGLWEELRYAGGGGVGVDELAAEWSGLGVEVLEVLGKREMGVVSVLAGWVRAGWLKYTGFVTEAWHAVGAAIRDAQEIGLHRDSLDPKPASDSVEDVLENQWKINCRRTTWMTLVLWDMHMAVVLGRPTTTDLSMRPPSLPIDTPTPKDRYKTLVIPRGENDPPTPLTRALWACHVLQPLREILEMEREGPCPKNFERVERVHNELLRLEACTPAWMRLENPDTRFDALPECYWVPLSRVLLPQLLTFELMALHRPYIFTRPTSRTEALKASLRMLHVQRLHFMALTPQMYKTFSLFFGTFDAIVLMASIYILFPREHPDLMPNALQHFCWAYERFEAMATRNSLAKAALGVLRAIYVRMKKALGLPVRPPLPSSSTSPASGAGSTPHTNASSTSHHSPWDTPGTSTTDFSPPPHRHSQSQPQTDLSLASFDLNLDPSLFPDNTNSNPSINGNSASNGNTPLTKTTNCPPDWAQQLPTDFDWSSLQPIYATSDLVYHDLMCTTPATTIATTTATAATDATGGLAWDHRVHLQGQTQGHSQDMDVGLTSETGEMQGGGMDMGMGMSMGSLSMGTGMGLYTSVTGEVCQFDGEFGDDSVWSLLNQYGPF